MLGREVFWFFISKCSRVLGFSLSLVVIDNTARANIPLWLYHGNVSTLSMIWRFNPVARNETYKRNWKLFFLPSSYTSASFPFVTCKWPVLRMRSIDRTLCYAHTHTYSGRVICCQLPSLESEARLWICGGRSSFLCRCKLVSSAFSDS